MAKYYMKNREYCVQEQTNCIDDQQLVDFYVYVLGDRHRKIVQISEQASKY